VALTSKLLSADCMGLSAWSEADAWLEQARANGKRAGGKHRRGEEEGGEYDDGSGYDDEHDGASSSMSLMMDTESLLDGMGLSSRDSSPILERPRRSRGRVTVKNFVGGPVPAVVTSAVRTLSMQLYQIIIPTLAKRLDAQLFAMPLDSHGVAKMLHANGVNIRHLGLLYPLCKTTYVRQTLLCEIVARSLKLILRDTLQRAARQAKGQAMVAEKKGRSFTKDFMELMRHSNAKRGEIVLELLNLVFGSTKESKEFWAGMMAHVIGRKFGVVVPSKEAAMEVLYLPQLLVAMQYHLGIKVANTVYGDFGAEGLTHPLEAVDLVDAGDVVDAKISDQLNIPGELGLTESSAELLFVNGLFKEAAHAFEFRHFCHNLLHPMYASSIKRSYMLSSLVYKLALSHFMNGNLPAASKVMKSHLLVCPKFTVVTARLLALLMCATFRQGRLHEALEYFDAAQQIYTFILGDSHPILSLHMCTLADLYYKWDGYDASVEAYVHPLHPLSAQSNSSVQQSRNNSSSKALLQCKVMLLLAHAAAKKALGPSHVVIGHYEKKLALVCMEEGSTKEAAAYLTSALATYEWCSSTMAGAEMPLKPLPSPFTSLPPSSSLTADSFPYIKETIGCLYSTAVCYFKTRDVDLAIHSGFRCIDMCSKIVDSSKPMDGPSSSPEALLKQLALSPLPSVGGGSRSRSRDSNSSNIDQVPMVLISCLLLLSDAFKSKNEFDSAFEILEEAWAALKTLSQQVHPVQSSSSGKDHIFSAVGRAMVTLASRVLELTMTSISLQSRSLFYSIVHEVCSGEGQGEHTMDPSLWEKACKVVGDAIWNYKPSDYFAVVFHNLRHLDVQGDGIRGNGGRKGNGQGRRINNSSDTPIFLDTSSVSYALQAAVMAGLLPQPMQAREYSRSLLL
jgi:tetratricopeptide (TPR) repeat protein